MSDDPHLEVPDMDDTEQVVLIRIVEWTEWIPGHPDQTGSLNMHNGFTGFVSSASEKLLSANVMGTGKNLDFACARCGGSGEVEVQDARPYDVKCEECSGVGKFHYGLYAMQATLAQNVSTNVYEALQAAQNLPIMEEFERQKSQGRDKRDDLVVVEHKKPPPPPRKKRKR
jgi:hypothetical protein